jgi:hypothetical protein
MGRLMYAAVPTITPSRLAIAVIVGDVGRS